MMYVLAWVVIGFCSYLITKNNWERDFGKYGMAIWAHCRTEGNVTTQLLPDDAAEIRKVMNITAAALFMVLAPLGVWVAFRSSFDNEKRNEFKVVIDEYVKRHGMIF